MGSLEYRDLYEKDVSLTTEELEFYSSATPMNLHLRLKPVWDDDGSHFKISTTNNAVADETALGTTFLKTDTLHISKIVGSNDSNYITLYNDTVKIEEDGNIHAKRYFGSSHLPYTDVHENEMVSKKQVHDYLLNYLTEHVEFNNTTLIKLIEEALIEITLPDVQEEKIIEVINDYRQSTGSNIGSLTDDVIRIVRDNTYNNDTSMLITDNVLESRLENYIETEYIQDLAKLNVESSRLFDYPMEPFYLRLDDYVANYVTRNTPNVDAANVVYLDYLQANYYTKTEVQDGGFGGGGGGNVDINIDHLLTRLEANETYVKKSDFFTADGNVHFEYVVESNINVFRYEIHDIKPFVGITIFEDFDAYSYQVDSVNPNKITLFGVGLPTIDHVQLGVDDRVLLSAPITNVDTGVEDTIYNGIFSVTSVLSDSIVLERSIDFKSIDSIVNALVYVNSRSSDSQSNGNSYLVTHPNANNGSFRLNVDNIEIIPFIQQDNTHGSMAYQDHRNVAITGGSIAVTQLNTSSITSIDADLTIHIPADKQFEITSVLPGESGYDPIFSVDEQGHASAFQFAQMSDIKLKKNIKPIESSMDLINKLTGKTFEWKEDAKNKRGLSYGFIAQEVQHEIPSLVSETLNGYLTVDYAKVIPILTEAIKELYTMVSERTERAATTAAERATPDSREYVFTERDTTQSANNSINVIPQIVGNNVTTNVYSIGKASTYFVNAASTNQDSIVMEPLFISVENRQIYSIFSNNGSNTIDGVNLEIDDVVLIKDSQDPKYNGVFKITGIQHVSFGRFSKCYRVDDFKTFDVMQHAIVVVSPTGYAGNGKGDINVGVSFTCVIDALNTVNFELDTTAMSFVSFGLNPQLGSMSRQDSHSVNITGGVISTNEFITSNVFPYDNNSTITMNLKGSTVNDTFQVKNDSSDTIFSVDGTGRASAFEYYAPSDAKLKKNIQGIDNALELVQLLQGVTFDWKKNSSSDVNYGFIAQDVVKHFPSLVFKRADGYLAVDYSKVVSILVESVKDIGNMLKK